MSVEFDLAKSGGGARAMPLAEPLLSTPYAVACGKRLLRKARCASRAVRAIVASAIALGLLAVAAASVTSPFSIF